MNTQQSYTLFILCHFLQQELHSINICLRIEYTQLKKDNLALKEF